MTDPDYYDKCPADIEKAYIVIAIPKNIGDWINPNTGADVNITFVPHLLPMNRGMETTIYANLSRDIADADIFACLAAYYAGRPFIRISETGRPPDTRNVRGTNYCDIAFVVDRDHRRLILMSAIDNLVKGAAGQAVQNMNIMLGLEETAGLDMTPFPV
ncbi:MAG: Asd/ArgC dimerization domain-containing protein, partial [Desulfosalsimonadaceae bacterium]